MNKSILRALRLEINSKLFARESEWDRLCTKLEILINMHILSGEKIIAVLDSAKNNKRIEADAIMRLIQCS